MSSITVSKLNYLEGISEAYAETVSRVGKPLASFDITFDDEPDNWETIKSLEKSIKEKARDYNIKCYVRKDFSEFKDRKGVIFTKPNVEFNYYLDDRVLQEYISIINKSNRSKLDHLKLGKIFGYKKEKIKEFLDRQ